MSTVATVYFSTGSLPKWKPVSSWYPTGTFRSNMARKWAAIAANIKLIATTYNDDVLFMDKYEASPMPRGFEPDLRLL